MSEFGTPVLGERPLLGEDLEGIDSEWGRLVEQKRRLEQQEENARNAGDNASAHNIQYTKQGVQSRIEELIHIRAERETGGV